MSSQYYFEVNPLVQLVGSGRPVALFLDFDGTLVPIAKDPTLPRLSPGTKRLLESILGSGNSMVTIASGRPVADLRKRALLRGAIYVGSHGLEILGKGIRFIHKAALLAQPVTDTLYRDLMEQTEGWEGIIIERKPYSFALHYRAAGSETIPLLRRLLKEKVAKQPDYRHLVTVLRGKKVLEVAPRVKWNKGAAALHIIELLGDKYLPVCLGDDLTDETLFEAFRGTGITIRVGASRTTLAQYHLKSQREVLQLLDEIHHNLTSGVTGTRRKESDYTAEVPPSQR